MSTELAKTNGFAMTQPLGADIERVLVEGDLSALTSAQRVVYYNRTCDSLDLNPLTRPFDYLKLNGKLVLYPNKGCGEQLRKNRRVSVTITDTKVHGDVYLVVVSAVDRDGRTDSATGAVTIGSLKGDALCNAMMKAETKAKRRVTLSICGLNMVDESELETIPSAKKITVTEDGEIVDPKLLTGDSLLSKLSSYYERIDYAQSVNDLKNVYADALLDAGLSDAAKTDLKNKCSAKKVSLMGSI